MAKQKSELLRQFFIWSAIWLTPIAGLLALYSYVWQSAVLVVLLGILGLFEAMNVATLFEWYGYARETERWRRQNFAAILKENAVLVTEVRSSAAAVLEAEGDEGDLFIFDIGDGRLLWMHGQDVRPTAGNRSWPNDHFEIIRSTDGVIDIALRSLGKKIKTVASLSRERFASLSLPAEEVVVGNIENVYEVFVNAEQARPSDG